MILDTNIPVAGWSYTDIHHGCFLPKPSTFQLNVQLIISLFIVLERLDIAELMAPLACVFHGQSFCGQWQLQRKKWICKMRPNCVVFPHRVKDVLDFRWWAVSRYEVWGMIAHVILVKVICHQITTYQSLSSKSYQSTKAVQMFTSTLEWHHNQK